MMLTVEIRQTVSMMLALMLITGLVFGLMPEAGEATTIPIASGTERLSNYSGSAQRYEPIEIKSYSAPSGRSIGGLTFNYYKTGSSDAAFRIYVRIDGETYSTVNVVTSNYGTYSISGLDAQEIVFAARRDYASGTLYIENIEVDLYLLVELADEEARDAAVDAKNAANTAASNAANAKTSADTAAARVWDSAESKSAATLAKEARDKANEAVNAVNALQASIGPQIHKVQGFNGATATTTSSFNVIVDASGAIEFRAQREGGTWTGWTTVHNSVSVSGLTAGVNTIQVEVRNASGATATGRMIVFRL